MEIRKRITSRAVGVLAMLALPLFTGGAFAATGTGVWVGSCGDVVMIQNARVRVDYNLAQGSYSIVDRKDSLSRVSGACLRVNEMASNSVGLKNVCQSRPVKDAIGVGRKLTVTTIGLGRPELVLDITLYKNQSFVVLAAGIDNTTSRPVRIRYINPMVGGVAFDRLNPKSDLKIVDNPLALAANAVTPPRPNNILIAFTKGEMRKSLVFGQLTRTDFPKCVGAKADDSGIALEMYCRNDAGKLVEPGERYTPDDRFYLDLTARSESEAVERYGAVLGCVGG